MKRYEEQRTTPEYNFPTFNVHGLSSAGLVGEIAVTIIIVAGMVIDGTRVAWAITAGVVYFSLFHVVVMSFLSGTIRDVWINHQVEVTKRRELHVIRHNLNAATSTVRALPDATTAVNYLPAAEANTIKDARSWLATLYDVTDPEAAVDPSKVHMRSKRERAGRLRVGAPAPDVLEFLLLKGVITRINNGYALNVQDYPNLACVTATFFEDRGQGTPPLPPHHTPPYTGERA